MFVQLCVSKFLILYVYLIGVSTIELAKFSTLPLHLIKFCNGPISVNPCSLKALEIICYAINDRAFF